MQRNLVDNEENRIDVAEAKAGDTAAFTRLVLRHDERLRRFVHGLLANRSELDDVLQETYIKAYRSLGAFKEESSFATWLHRIAYNTAIDMGRRSSRVLPFAQVESTAEPIDAIRDAGDRMDVLAALQALPERQRAAILLVDGHGYDYASVAEILDIPTGTVAFHLHRARKVLRSKLAITTEEIQ